MALHFKDHTRIPLGDDVFLSVNVINGKGLFNLWKARKIVSPIHPNRTITVPGPFGVCISYDQFIELIDKAPLMISIINSMWKEKSETTKRKAIDDSQENSRKSIVLDEPVVQRIRRQTSHKMDHHKIQDKCPIEKILKEKNRIIHESKK